MPKSVLFLIDSLAGRRGTELHLLELCRRLPSLGYRPIVCNLGGDELVLRDLAALGVETWPFVIRRAYTPEGWRAIRELSSRIQPKGIALIQTYHFKSDVVGSIIAKRLRLPHISSRRDLGFQHTLSQRMVYRAINPTIRAFIAPSMAVREKLVEQDEVDPTRVQIIPNGVDVDRYSGASDERRQMVRDALGISSDEVAVGCVASLSQVKDHGTLLRAFAHAARTQQAKLVLVGTGPEQSRLKKIAQSLGILDRTVFAGERSDVADVLTAFDIFALSSRSEGMPNALLEAMSTGLPVAATSAGGITDCVMNGVTGLLSPVGEDQPLSENLARLIASRELRLSMGDAGRRRAVEHFSLRRTVELSAELFARLGVIPDESSTHAA